MFSANENLALRQHKRRITQYVESTMPEDALDAGTMALVMQVSCRAPGCVPLETAIAIVFPRGQRRELVEGLPESGAGGTFKTKVLMPMAEVTKDDVLDALPPQFEGGRRTMEKLCLRARDVMLAQISQIMNEEDEEGKRLMAEYLVECLTEYVGNGCKAPELGEPFPPKKAEEKKEEDGMEARKEATVNGGGRRLTEPAAPTADNGRVTKRGVSATGNFVVRRAVEKEVGSGVSGGRGDTAGASGTDPSPVAAETSEPRDASSATGGDAAVPDSSRRQKMEWQVNPILQMQEPTTSSKSAATSSSEASAAPTASESNSSPSSSQQQVETATDWRRRQKMEWKVNSVLQMQESPARGLIQTMAEREHAPGVRRAGCPCCDPDNPSNVVDSMMML